MENQTEKNVEDEMGRGVHGLGSWCRLEGSGMRVRSSDFREDVVRLLGPNVSGMPVVVKPSTESALGGPVHLKSTIMHKGSQQLNSVAVLISQFWEE